MLLDCIQGYIQQYELKKEKAGRAIVFALYGTGNAPLRKGVFLDLVKRAIALGIDIVVSSQCPYGRTKLESYATGSRLLDMGVISSFDMTIEAVVTKLAYLMGRGLRGTELKRVMETNIRGELCVVDTTVDHVNANSAAYGKRIEKMF